MAKELEVHLLAAQHKLWDAYNAVPNPSEESITILRRIRNVEKTLRAVNATMDRQGW